jgi:hypothetical protein
LTKIDLGAELASYDDTTPKPVTWSLADYFALRDEPERLGTLKELQAEGFKPIPPHIQTYLDFRCGGQP